MWDLLIINGSDRKAANRENQCVQMIGGESEEGERKVAQCSLIGIQKNSIWCTSNQHAQLSVKLLELAKDFVDFAASNNCENEILGSCSAT